MTIGSGGAAGTQGSNSVFSTITSDGGGRANASGNGFTGGSGGGAAETGTTGGAGTANQGFAGGAGGRTGSSRMGGGGGGAGGAGASFSGYVGGNSGLGLNIAITGSTVAYAGGGVGGADDRFGGSFPSPGLGGTAGNTNGTANRGAGGGGKLVNAEVNGAGGSGVVILRYPSAYTITIGAGLTGTTATVSSNKVTTITAGSGNVSWA